MKNDFSLSGSGHFARLVTTDVSGDGEAGAPVLGGEGRIMAVVIGGSAAGSETYSIPIESIKRASQDAF